MDAEFILLGCSVSAGVPTIGNDWGACDPNEPKNRRNRACALIRSDNTTIVIDTGPDFRQQMNEADIAEIDAVLYTHDHCDHIQGIDELRVISGRMQKLIDIYAYETTLAGLHKRFDYLFKAQSFYQKVLNPHKITKADLGKSGKIGDIEYIPFYQDHGDCDCIGYRLGNIGYSADMHNIAPDAIKTLKGIDVWIADGAGHNIEDHPTHAPLSRLFKLNEEIGAAKVYITGLSKFMDYQTLKRSLPQGFEPAYDGLRVPVKFTATE